MADGFILFTIGFFQILDKTKCFSALFHGKFQECIPGSRGWRGAQHLNGSIRKGGINIFPGFVGVFHEGRSALSVWNIGCKGKKKIFSCQLEWCCFFGIGNNNAVITYFHLNDLFCAVFNGSFKLGLFNSPGSVGDIRIFNANTCTEEFKSSA